MNSAGTGRARQKPVAGRGKRRGASASSTGSRASVSDGSVSDTGNTGLTEESKNVDSRATQDAEEKHIKGIRCD